MAGKLQAPRGTFDVLPGDARRRAALAHTTDAVLGRAGYEPFETPVFEDTELFARGVGEATDIVRKEMFTFEDKAGRSLTLRPEGTAGVCRAYVEHGMHKLPQPVKLRYWGPYFRHESPQAGRFRQFTQIGAEALGSDDPSLDAEIVLLLVELVEAAGARDLRVRLSSLGTPETREAYLAELREYLREHEAKLSEDVRERLAGNPLRAFDADHPGTRAVMERAPRLLDRLSADDAEHFAAVRALLDDSGLDYEVDTTLVRGLDYYTRTVFEVESGILGAQNALGGGGRYDRLVEQLGGPSTPGVGLAAGVERILLAVAPEDHEPSGGVYVAVAAPAAAAAAFALATQLRRRGVRVELEQAGRSLKGQLRQADRIGARATVIVGDAIEVKDMGSGEQTAAAGPEEALTLVENALDL
ncbi:MAG TPA: histidine--tRNA ligase [Thermoleophilaceae bacterium]|nr:histidine--tRNA ligase [Thermoleophilaceae bacterium]